ncbi:hypothetical protein XENOCAPTIV_024831 [Xenoophorus captivus]|uniref:Uncharacterized protein n=1 Tax=Xenoophorus captivus TaxID=1517983 RepID=A0ABV0R1Y3_9TELE
MCHCTCTEMRSETEFLKLFQNNQSPALFNGFSAHREAPVVKVSAQISHKFQMRLLTTFSSTQTMPRCLRHKLIGFKDSRLNYIIYHAVSSTQSRKGLLCFTSEHTVTTSYVWNLTNHKCPLHTQTKKNLWVLFIKLRDQPQIAQIMCPHHDWNSRGRSPPSSLPFFYKLKPLFLHVRSRFFSNPDAFFKFLFSFKP